MFGYQRGLADLVMYQAGACTRRLEGHGCFAAAESPVFTVIFQIRSTCDLVRVIALWSAAVCAAHVVTLTPMVFRSRCGVKFAVADS